MASEDYGKIFVIARKKIQNFNQKATSPEIGSKPIDLNQRIPWRAIFSYRAFLEMPNLRAALLLLPLHCDKVEQMSSFSIS